MKSVGERIKELRDKKGLSQEELAARTSEIANRRISRQSLSSWESGKSTPRSDNLSAVAVALGVDLAILLDSQDTKKAPVGQETNEGYDRVEKVEHNGVNGDKIIAVPVYEDFLSACAGWGNEAADIEGVVKEILPVPLWLICPPVSLEPGKRPFIVTVYGDSMTEANLPNGTQVLVNPIAEVFDRDIVVAEFDGEWMVKWIYFDRDGGGQLRSSSAKYPPRYFTKEDIQNERFKIIGKVCRGMTLPQRGE